MVGLAVHNFISAATGIAIAIALVRGLARRSADAIGNFWVDLTRAILYILLPLSIVLALVFAGARACRRRSTATPRRRRSKGRADDSREGPVASQEAIKQLGHERRRLLQRQLGAPVREPDPADQLPANAVDLRDPRRA